MMPNILRREDLDFLLYDVLDIEELVARPRYAGSGRDVFDQVLDTAEKVAEEHFLPHAAKLDANEPTFDGERVDIIPEVREALDAFIGSGFLVAPFDQDVGGMQLPYTIHTAVNAWFVAANWSTANYPALTSAAAHLLAEHASDAQKAEWLKPMLEGRFFGTMCLSEPHAGSSVGDIRTRAEPQADGSYRLFGSKMWISGGEHDLSENIVNLVLAKIPGGPPGTKGISLFIVPRIIEGTRNDIRLVSLNHKMGCRGTVNCALNFGEEGGAIGWLVGEPHQGLAQMFTMMNEMRIGVGMAGASLGYTGYLNSLDYARERPQGRPIGAKDPAQPMVPIIDHADVKRMLLQQKCYVEGGMALVLYAASLFDRVKSGDQEDVRRSGLLLDLLTPIVKSWPSEYGLRANEIAIQILGGAGYTRDYPLERFYRDNRLNHIHEGTRGIQGMDLLGRKVPAENGAALRALLDQIVTDATASGLPEASELARDAALAGETTMEMLTKSMATGPETLLANATLYLDMIGHVVVGWLWLKQAEAAAKELPDATGTREDFLQGKLTAFKYFFRYELPAVRTTAELLASMDTTTVEAEAAIF
ncbi:MAG: acyl-CoA dehydrogenase [Pseudomonadota bacterium]